MIPKVQQLISTDELHAGEIEQLWLEAIIDELNIVPERLPAEITHERIKDTNVTTLWSQGRPVAYAIRQRDQGNYTVLTTVIVGVSQRDQSFTDEEQEHDAG